MADKQDNISRRNFLIDSTVGVCLGVLGSSTRLLAEKNKLIRPLSDLEGLEGLDTKTVAYEQMGQAILTKFKSSYGIAVDYNKDIYIAGDRAIRIFNEGGELLKDIKLSDVPRCVTVTEDKIIYIGTKEHVLVYNIQLKPIAKWQSLGVRSFLTSIANWKNEVFVADAGNRIVIRYDTAGRVINRIGKKDKNRNIPGFVVPSPYFDIAVGQDGLLRAVNPGLHRIEAYTFDGDLEFWWGEFSNVDVKGFSGCCNPVNFAMLEGDSFITSEKGLLRIKRYDNDGTFKGVIANAEELAEDRVCRICDSSSSCRRGGFDVAVDAEGRIFVLDTIKNIVRIFTRKKTG